MQRIPLLRAAAWPAAAAVACGVLLTGLLTFAGSTVHHSYADFPNPAMRVGLPSGYDYCGASQISPPVYVICDHLREADLAAARPGFEYDVRYYVWVFDAQSSSRLGYNAAKGIESVRGGVTRSYFRTRLVPRPVNNPTLEVSSVSVDGNEALDFRATILSPDTGAVALERLVVIDLRDGRLLEVFNEPAGPISPSLDDLNFREIVRGIKFHD